MADIFFIKGPGGVLTPKTDDDSEKMKAWPTDSLIRVKATRVRNARYHNLIMGLCQFVVGYSAVWDSNDDLLKFLKEATGHCTTKESLDGKPYTDFESISFDNMDEIAWRPLAEKFKNALLDPRMRRFYVPMTDKEYEQFELKLLRRMR